MEQAYVYTICKIPHELLPLLTELAQALGIGTPAALVHLALYGAGGDAIGGADMDLYERLKDMDAAYLSMAQADRANDIEVDDIPF